MAEFYVIVSQLGKGMRKSKQIIPKLCGKLWYEKREYAEKEARDYSNTPALNGGLSIEWLMEDWYVVTCVTFAEASRMKGFRKFKKNRVTPEPLGSLTLWPNQPDWNEIANRPKRQPKFDVMKLVPELQKGWLD